MTQLDDSKNTGNEFGGAICACELAEPCMSQCTCANGFMSGGCLRCATYGSAEQREASAKRIAVASSVVQPPNTGNELDEILRLFEQNIIHDLIDCENDEDKKPTDFVPEAKSKLTKYIEQEIKKARIEELDEMPRSVDFDRHYKERFNKLRGESNGR